MSLKNVWSWILVSSFSSASEKGSKTKYPEQILLHCSTVLAIWIDKMFFCSSVLLICTITLISTVHSTILYIDSEINLMHFKIAHSQVTMGFFSLTAILLYTYVEGRVSASRWLSKPIFIAVRPGRRHYLLLTSNIPSHLLQYKLKSTPKHLI